MKQTSLFHRNLTSLVTAIMLLVFASTAFAQTRPELASSIQKLETELVTKYGDAAKPRLQKGLSQVAQFWTPEDGDAAAFEDFVRTHFAGDQATLDITFSRLEYAFEQLNGHMLEISRELRTPVDLDLGPTYPIDDIFSAYDPSAHLDDDFFQNRLAFVVLLNFPLTTLDERLASGASWTRRQWAEARLAQRFSRRVPASVNLEIARAGADSEKYIAEYNIWMHHVLTDDGKRLFPAKLRLLSHWNLRDEIKAQYSEKDGLPKQRLIQKVMERIVTQTIPEIVVDNPTVDWKPGANVVSAATASDSEQKPEPGRAITNNPEPDTRYAMLLNNYRAYKLVDPYSPTAPTLIARKFNEERELPEARVRAMFEAVLTSPLANDVGRLIEKRLKRKLEPFDIWYNGFRPRGQYTEAQLDEIVAKRYPTPKAFEEDIPNILTKLGFAKDKADYLASMIAVDPARGSGHAWGAARRGDKARLRTRVGSGGMNYKGYNIAVHELGHNVEQTLSLNQIDHTLLNGVPNTAFTEALAFVFQGYDLELLGLAKPDAETKALTTLNDYWGTFEIAGVGLVDMAVWHWMYDHPDATPQQLREATIQISKDVWNKYYAPIFKKKDVVLLGVYSHMIERQIYLPDYPIGHMIAFQVEHQMEKAGNIGPEFERIVMMGSVTPDLWMINATGAPVGPEALLAATRVAIDAMKK